MSRGSTGLFRFAVVKDATHVARSRDGAAPGAGCAAPIESDSELVLDLRQAIRAGDDLARQIAETWLESHDARLAQALEPLGEIRSRLDRSAGAGTVNEPPSRPSNRRSRKRFSCDDATRQLVGDAIVASAIARPRSGAEQATLTRAWQTANYLLAMQGASPPDMHGRLRLLSRTPVLPAGIIPPARPHPGRTPGPGAGRRTEEPLSYRMVAGTLEALRAIDGVALLAGRAEDGGDQTPVPAAVIERIPAPLRDALAARRVDPAGASLPGLAGHLADLRRRLYREERRIAGVPPGRRFEPGEWRDLEGLGWRYVFPTPAASAPRPHARVAASADWTFVEGSGWALVADTARADNDAPAAGNAALGASLRVLGVADLLGVAQQRIRYQAGEIARLPDCAVANGLHPAPATTEDELAGDVCLAFERAVSEVVDEDRASGRGARLSTEFGTIVPLERGPGLEGLTAEEAARRTAFGHAADIVERAVGMLRRRRLRPQGRTAPGEGNGADGGRGATAACRWLDAVCELRLESRGRRLMIEAVVPRPGDALRGAEDMAPFTIGVEDVTEDSYADLAAAWRADDIRPPPPEYRSVGVAVTTEAGPEGTVNYAGMLAVPPGYRCIRAIATVHRGASPAKPGDDLVITLAGRPLAHLAPGRLGIAPDPDIATGELPFTLGTVVPVGVGLALSITATCRRIDEELLRAWQIDTYAALLRGHRRLAAEREAPGDGDAGEAREEELQALRTLCIEAMAGHCTSGGEHALLAGEAGARGHAFFDDCFDWANLSYDLYPDFWAQGGDLGAERARDRARRTFQQAGAARVRIPVTPGHEGDVLYFLDFGGLSPDNAGMPVAGERLALLADIESFAAAEAENGSPLPWGEPWRVRIPLPALTAGNGDDLPAGWISLTGTDADIPGANDNA